MSSSPRKEGTGKTLHEAFEEYGRQKGIEKIAERSGLTLEEALQQFDQEWFDVEIAVQLQPHNQHIKAYRVKDPNR